MGPELICTRLNSSNQALLFGSLPNLTFGAFRLDARQRVLWRDGVSAEFGRRACDILCALIAAKGEAFSKERANGNGCGVAQPDRRIERVTGSDFTTA
jgi:DNA-binding response OmpR family regulator